MSTVSKKQASKEFIVLTPDGGRHDVDPAHWEDLPVLRGAGSHIEALAAYLGSSFGRKAAGAGTPTDYMEVVQNHRLAQDCPGSEEGHLAWLPKGNLIKSLLLDYQEQRFMRPYGAVQIETPVLCRPDAPGIQDLAGKYLDRIYLLDEGGLALRWNTDPGLFSLVGSLPLTRDKLPLKISEPTLSFRKEQSGELAGLERTRSFVLTELHVFCADEAQALAEYLTLSGLCATVMGVLCRQQMWLLVLDVEASFFRERETWFASLAAAVGTPVLVKLMKARTHYYSLQSQFQYAKTDGGCTQVANMQLDFVNGERFGIRYAGAGGHEACTIVHTTPYGRVEKAVLAVIDSALRAGSAGAAPALPTWLSPTQARIVPVSPSFLPAAAALRANLEARQVRADVDDRDLPLGKRIKAAEREWIPDIVVVGEKETREGVLSVRVRNGGSVTEAAAALAERIVGEVQGYPHRPLPLPTMLSERLSSWTLR